MKPKSARGASTRQRIIETAAKLMYKNGVNGTSVDDVLAASGTGKSQFYHYFTSKDALVKELIEFHVQSLPAAREELLANLSSLAGIEAWLEQIGADQRAGLYEDGCPIGNLASELSGQNEELRQSLQATFAHWETRLTEGLRSMRAKGQLRPDVSPEALSMFVVAAVEGGLLLAKTQRSPSPLEASLAQLKSHVRAQCLGATRKRPEPQRHGRLTFCP